LRQKLKKWGMPKKTSLTQREPSKIELEYLGEFECENSLGCETVARGEMFDEKNRGRNLVKLSI
jgi:hypothetical protein